MFAVAVHQKFAIPNYSEDVQEVVIVYPLYSKSFLKAGKAVLICSKEAI